MSSNNKQGSGGSSHSRSHSAHDDAGVLTTPYDIFAQVGELEVYEMANKGPDWWVAHFTALEKNDEKAVRRHKKIMAGTLHVKEYVQRKLAQCQARIAAEEAEAALLEKILARTMLMTQKGSSE